MSEPNAPAPPGEAEVPFDYDDQLQFDQAEYSTLAPRQAGATCTSCHQPIVDAYFETGGKVVCATCRQRIEEAFRGGSRLARGMRALLFGMLAAIAGAIGYYLIIRMTGYNIGLIAIVVGLMVGGGVRAGSGNRGGRFYQVLALFLTYLAIVGMNLPFVAESFLQIARQEPTQLHAPANRGPANEAAARRQPEPRATAAKNSTRPLANAPPGQAGDAASPAAADHAASQKTKTVEKERRREPKEPPSLAGLLMALTVVLVIVFIAPVLETFQAPVSGLIYAFALWEAWKINKKVHLTFNGPFRVSAAPEGGAALEVVGDGA